MKNEYKKIFKHYENCFFKHGDNHKGVDWPNKDEATIRYKVMLDLINAQNNLISLLDFGCGASHLYDFIVGNNLNYIDYTGLDISKVYIDFSKNKYPNNKYIQCDILRESNELENYDYIVMNGVFTEKIDLEFDRMFYFLKSILSKLWNNTNIGIAFNVMSELVDWKRDDLFHLSIDLLGDFLCKNISRNFIIRNDYGLYEYTCYVYK